MDEPCGEHADPQLRFLQRLIEENAFIAGDVAEISTHLWAIHGVIPIDGEVIMAEFETYDQARVVLDQLSISARRDPSI